MPPLAVSPGLFSRFMPVVHGSLDWVKRPAASTVEGALAAEDTAAAALLPSASRSPRIFWISLIVFSINCGGDDSPWKAADLLTSSSNFAASAVASARVASRNFGGDVK